MTDETTMSSTSVGYLYVPTDVMSSTELGLREKAMWGRLEAFADGEGVCRETNERLGHQLNLSKRQVQRLLSSLENEGYLRREFERDEKGQIVERRLVPTHPHRDSDFVTTPMTEPESRQIGEDARGNGGNPEKDGMPILSSRSSLYTQEQLEGLSEEERAVRVVWEHYLSRYADRYSEHRADRLKLDTCGREGHIRARLEEGYSPEELCRAIDGNFSDDWYRDRDKHELEFIVRNQSRVEEFLSKAGRSEQTSARGGDGRDELTAMQEAAGE